MRACGSVVLLANGVLLSCAGALGDPELDEAALHDTAGAPVIVTLQTREGLLTVTSAGGHVRYHVPGLSEGVTLEQLAGQDPELSELLREATAVGAALGWAPILDASRGHQPASDPTHPGAAGLRSR
jgi:hypothetical protein